MFNTNVVYLFIQIILFIQDIIESRRIVFKEFRPFKNKGFEWVRTFNYDVHHVRTE